MSSKMKKGGKFSLPYTVTKDQWKYPSGYGSHAVMVDAEKTALLSDSSFVVCKDDQGLYATEKCRLDCGMADPFRCASEEWRTANLQKLLG